MFFLLDSSSLSLCNGLLIVLTLFFGTTLVDSIIVIGVITTNIGQRIKELRETRGLSQNKLAKLADIARSSLSYIESGEKAPNIETIKSIAFALDVSQSYLLGENLPKSKQQALSPKLEALLEVADTFPSEKLNILIENAKAMRSYSDNR